MKKIMIVAAAALFSTTMFSACNGGTSSPKNEMDSLAYAVGVDMGVGIKQFDSTLNPSVIAAGIKAAFDGKATMTQEEASAFIQEYMYVRKPLKNKAASEKYLQDVLDNNAEAKKTENGIVYQIVEEGSDVFATNDEDVVKVVYEGSLRDGKVFDSSKGDTVEFALNRVIPGWREGMKLVGKGGKIKLHIPAELAYGERGVPQAGIEGNEALVFDVTLVDVIPAQGDEK